MLSSMEIIWLMDKYKLRIPQREWTLQNLKNIKDLYQTGPFWFPLMEHWEMSQYIVEKKLF